MDKQITVFQNEGYKKLGDLYGLFFEDINHAADGGLYAELVQNRSFEFCEIDRKDYHSLTAWEKSDGLEWKVCTEEPLNEENQHYLSVKAKAGSYIRNQGFNTGIFVEEGKSYRFSIFARLGKAEKGAECNMEGEHCLRISVEDEEQGTCAEASICLKIGTDGTETGNGAEMERRTVEAVAHQVAASAQWKQYEVVMQASRTTCCGRLQIRFAREAAYDMDMISLFPVDTFMGRRNGLRRDIAEALMEMKPKFLRFPGGCLTHDGSLDDHARNSMYRWKRTLGKVEERPTWRNNWGYNQTLGLGYYEYFCFCEDIGAKPLPVVPGGFNPHKGEGADLKDIQKWVQETLDLIEFAVGGTDMPMGAIRAQMGHEAPFDLEYLGVGNEEIGAGFFERYPYFHEAIRRKYPQIKIINTAGPFAVGEGYEDGWKSARENGSDLVDEHYYSSPEWFLANMHHYEDYDEKGPRVFLGEYASWGNTYYNAIVEAAYMTHLERSKAVALACYAPMLCNVDYVNWQPDMLWFNNHEIMKTPNYYVQKMFMENQGTEAVRFEKKGLDEILSLTDEENLVGDITVTGNDIEGSIWDVQLTENGKCRSLQDVMITDNEEHKLADTNAEEYTLSFRFRRSSGRKGLKLHFGKQSESSYIHWEFGGWDNWDCNITSVSRGRGSTISHRIFHVEDMEYQLTLEVKGRHIKTYVNGQLYNDTEDRLPQLEELYITASVDEEAHQTILKVVNLTGEEKQTGIVLQGEEKKACRCICLSGYGLGDVNSFEKPDYICPKETVENLEENRLEHTFPAHSVTVLVMS